MATNVNSDDTYAKLRDKKRINVKLNKESDTEVIISSLETLQLKLKQLEDERNAASKLINRLNKSGENLLGSLNRKESLTKEIGPCDIQKHCDNIEQQLANILATTEQNAATSKLSTQNINKSTTTKDVKLSKRIHFKPDCRSLPFIPSGPSSTTFSLPATIQTLISNLKSQHNQLCIVSQFGHSLTNIIGDSEVYLKQLAETLQSSAHYLNVESLRLVSENQGDELLNGRVIAALTQLQVVVKLSQQIVELQKKIVFLKDEINDMTRLEYPVKSDGGIRSKPSDGVMKKSVRPCARPAQKRTQLDKVKKEVNVHPFHRQLPRKPLVRPESSAKVVHHNIETLRYIKLLQVALRRNGYKLKMTED